MMRFFGVFLLIAFGSLFIYYFNQPFDEVIIHGELSSKERALLQEKISSHLTQNYLSIDLNELSLDLKSFSWIYGLKVNRQLKLNAQKVSPFDVILEIRIDHHVPEAVWNSDYLLNQSGDIFSDEVDIASASLPELTGKKLTHKKVMRFYQELLSVLKTFDLKPLSLDLLDHGEWRVLLSSGVTLILRDSERSHQLKRFLVFYSDQIDNKSLDFSKIESIDLRYSKGLAVKFFNR